ncbi:MAG: hypothetical protein IIC73_01040 [Armatimonadetes bacterium]|nr:hypothetical protein [Armatimonadota bacterium]
MDGAAQVSSFPALLGMKVPAPLFLYAMLGSADLAFSKAAFSYGVVEGNPAMRLALGLGLLEVSKVLLTTVVVVVGMILWHLSYVRRIMLVANIGMATLAVYHVYGLSLHI